MHKKCQQCNKPFVPKRNTSGKFCSHLCYWFSLKGKPSNRPKLGKNIICKICNKEFYSKKCRINNFFCSNECRGVSLDGKRISPKTEFKKGRISEWKGKKRPELLGEKNRNWKNNEVGYNGLHHWIYRRKGKPKQCKNCGKKGNNRKIHWANIDHKYKRELNDFIPLCCSCHKKFDLGLIELV